MVTINGTDFDTGMPKICIPLVESDEENIIKEALRIEKTNCDVVEWRIDFYEEVYDKAKVVKLLSVVKEAVGKKILLVTFRTKSEGGQMDINATEYKSLLLDIIESRKADLVDIQLFIGEDVFREVIAKARENNVHIIASNHDFQKTPVADEIVDRLMKMYELGADISKIAVMPQSIEDVAELLKATAIMKNKHKEVTVVTMSMDRMGMISRVAGEIFGSAMTFGILDKPSAPGQIQIDKLQKIMKNINEI